jgi:hypothetical protein
MRRFIIGAMALVVVLGGCAQEKTSAPVPPTPTPAPSATAEIGPESGLQPGPQACKSHPSNYTCSDSDDMLIFPELVAAIHEAQKHVTFPPGAWVDDPVDDGWYPVNGPAGMLGRSHWFPDEGIIDTEIAGYCLWSKVWLDEWGTNSKLEQQAQAWITNFPNTLTFTKYYDISAQTPTLEQIRAANLGDPSKLQYQFNVNCKNVKAYHWSR